MSRRLGPFELIEPLGRGGMGAVWRARHAPSGVAVAVKVLIAERARQERCRQEFRQEVRAVAALDHPGVVPVLDLGEIPPDADDREAGLVAGSPWLAMELGNLGALDRVEGPLPWPRLRRVLASLLDALAHAHARGLVHRDIKPANLLLGGKDAWDGTVRLVDFGLASVGEREVAGSTEDSVAGTPTFMAPEQFRGHWRDYGPRTDLYAVGCLAYQLASGRPAFSADSVFALAWAHTLGPRPELPGGLGLPEGFGRWVEDLMAVDAEQRPSSAADAAWSLAGLGGGGSIGPAPLLHALDPAGFESATIPAASDLDPGGATTRVEVVQEAPPGDGPPIPPTWRRPPPPASPPALRGIGLDLWGLRAVPFVGRGRQREVLWQALRDVAATGRPRLLLLQGAPGAGKTALARWLAERAEEVGAATVLWVESGLVPSPRHGIEAALARRFRTAGLDPGQRQERLATLPALRGLPAWVISGLSRLLGGAPSERGAILDRVFARLAASRPLLLVLDDLHRDEGTLALLPRLLDGEPPLLVLGAVPDVEPGGPAAVALEALARRDRASQLDVGPLPPAESLALARGLLGLDTGLAARLAERAAGDPGFMIQAVGRWVERGLVRPGEEGFQLAPGARIELPADQQRGWMQRLEDRLTAAPPGALPALEIAAALGVDVDLGEWAQACMEAGLGAISLGAVAESLLSAGLATAHPAGWTFTPARLREALARNAREGGRWTAWSRAAAATLGEAPAGAEGAERRGRYLLEAGEAGAALGPLLRAAELWQARGAPRKALAVLDLRARALLQAGLPASDERQGLGLALRARVHRFAGELDEALRWASRAEAEADKHRWPRVGALARLRIAQVAHLRGDLGASATLHSRVRGELDQLGLDRGCAEAEQALADLALRDGDLVDADRGFEEAAARFHGAGDAAGVGNCLRGRALAAKRRGDAGGARRWIDEAEEAYRRGGHLSGRADCLNTRAELDRTAGRLAAAEAGYQEAAELQEAVGASAAGLFPRINLALCLLAQGRWEEADASLKRSLLRAEAAGRRVVRACLLAFSVPAAAGLGRWEDAALEMKLARAALDEVEIAEPDVAWSSALAAELARAAGRPALAREALEVSADQWRRLGRPGPLREVLDRLAELT